MESLGVPAKDVISPQDHWRLEWVVFESQETPYSIAIGRWDHDPALVMRWNGNEEKPKGNPVSRGFPTWFVISRKFQMAIINELDLPPDAHRRCTEFLR
jgi:hypothetical protein